MGSEKLTIKDLLEAGFHACVEQGKAIPIAGLPLAFLDSIRKRCRELDRETLIDLSLKAKQIQIDDIQDALGNLYADNAEFRKKAESLANLFVDFMATSKSAARNGQKERLKNAALLPPHLAICKQYLNLPRRRHNSHKA